MKIRSGPQNASVGSVLMVTLFLAVLFGLFLFSYLSIVRAQRAQVSRSQAWNGALAMAEAGGEEALAQLNPGTPLPAVLDRTANGWGSPSAQGLYGPVKRTLATGTYSVCYTADTPPVIYATGYVAVPSIPTTIKRALRICTTNVPLFSLGLAAKYNLDFKGNNVNTDSFNSYDTNAWTSTTPKGTNGSVASMSGVVDVGNADINGSLYLGPTATNSIKSNGIVTGGVYNDFNADFPDVVLPQTTWLPATPNLVPVTIDGVAYQYTFGYPLPTSGDYVINGGFNGSIYVGANSNIRLLINGSASPTTIRVAGPGATAGKLTIYLNGPSFTLSGQDVVDGGVANDLTYYGTTNNTSINFSGNSSFTGTIYAPDASVSLGGGGNNTFDFVGASISSSFTMNGHFNFHFDEALLRDGPARAYVAKSWGEL